MKLIIPLLTALLLAPLASLHAQTNGPLRVHANNPRYFADASGQAILLAGSHTWNNLVDIGPDDPPQPIDFDAYLLWLKAHGHNFTRGWTWEPTRWDTTAMRNEAWRNGNHHVSPQAQRDKATQAAAATAPAAAKHKGDVTGVTVVRRLEQHPLAWRVWQPFIIPGDKKNHLIVAFGAMVNGKKDMGDILVTLSKDDGATWEEPVTVFDHQRRQGALQFAYANPVLYRPPGQAVVWCFAMRCLIAAENSEESHLVGAFSADGGRSWTPVEMAMHYTGPLITCASPMQVERDGQRVFLLPAHRNTLGSDPRGSRDHFILSSTSLLEWKLEAYIPQPTTQRVFLHEGNLAPGDSPDELKLVMRTANYDEDELTTDPPRAYSSVSRDGGRHWSVAREEPDLHNAKSKGFFGSAADGAHIYVYNDGPPQRVKAPGFPHGGRTSLRYKVKPPGGVWSAERTFYDAGIKNSYPTLVEVAPGEFRCVWDSGTANTARTHIHFGKLSLKP